MNELYFVTGNEGKFQEISEYIERHQLPIRLIKHNVDLDELQDMDEVRVLTAKAEQAWNLLRKPLIIDDGGFYFDEFGKFPGPLSKDVINGLGAKGLMHLSKLNPGVTIYSWIAYVDATGTVHTFRGETHGKCLLEGSFRGKKGLMFYGLYQADGTDKPLADIQSCNENDNLFHRLIAFRKFCDLLHLTH